MLLTKKEQTDISYYTLSETTCQVAIGSVHTAAMAVVNKTGGNPWQIKSSS